MALRSLVMAGSSTSALDFSVITEVADTIVTLVGKVIGMITSNPILLIGFGVGIFLGAVGIVKRFI